MSVAPPGIVTADATHVGRNVFAVADGIDDVAGSGAEALFAVVRLLDVVGAGAHWRPVLKAANWSLWHHANTDGHLGAPAATITAAMWTGYRFVIGHIGDSRAYLVHDGEALALTEDHTEAPSGSVGRRAARSDERVARLGQSLHGGMPDIRRVTPETGDRLVLCTDGLWRAITCRQMATMTSVDPVEACARLAAHAAAHASENASAVVVAVEAGPAVSQDVSGPE